ncbi:MAG: 4-(cytidine 5'-diphospho)-2-C-methyl-D-erythritol kinase [Gammaproteobacteria bacterium]|nr:4-(cytidine 5'-diphospho)-2-C-methyl-D-erythritol kinase [Gammaproteobacteria bacterium]MBT8134822.1 4-(cytidine 5'-diphospho)-2-C-methyl-D-erythritol kinase [Gammaproteobacteria bacterium]NNJ50961.1 4-(cytidine 5'-diphospho)-2-C-methyl-D-erythritol kinase [Gammaproteobacteria bacterium]
MLHIIGRREDGYHDLQTVFQFIDFVDELKFRPRKDDKIIRTCEDFEVPQDEDIIIRAARMLRERSMHDNPSVDSCCGVDIELIKNIPMGAGLGGGSSDAATTLIALNAIWGSAYSIDELAEMGLSLGADVPVFVRGFAAFAEGIGEKLRPVSLQEKWYLVLVPPVHISTKKVFENLHLTRDCSAIKLCDLSRHEWRNVCTPVVINNYPMVSQAIDIVNKYSKAKMSGTGASVFSSFDTKVQAEEVLQKIRSEHEIGTWISFVAKGLNVSPLHHFLESQTI